MREKANLAGPAFIGTGVVTRTDGALGIATHSLGDHADGWFTGGKLSWMGGATVGLAVEVKLHRILGGAAEFDLWQRATRPIVVGDTFTVTAGCDRRFSTCRDKFANAANFRGFPHMPGNDFVVRMPRQGEPGLHGGSLFR